MDNNILEDVLEVLVKEMIKSNFESKGLKEEKYIVSKQDLYRFCIRLIKIVKEVYYYD